MNDIEKAYIAGIIDGEGTITLTRFHAKENRRPVITVASTDLELLEYLQTIIQGQITHKKNYSPSKHKESYTLTVKNKEYVMYILKQIEPFLRVLKKRLRAQYIIENYDKVTPRNGRYNERKLKQKYDFEENFFKL